MDCRAKQTSRYRSNVFWKFEENQSITIDGGLQREELDLLFMCRSLGSHIDCPPAMAVCKSSLSFLWPDYLIVTQIILWVHSNQIRLDLKTCPCIRSFQVCRRKEKDADISAVMPFFSNTTDRGLPFFRALIILKLHSNYTFCHIA